MHPIQSCVSHILFIARHCQPENPKRPLAMVTASVQDLKFTQALDANHDLILNGYIQWIGRSSMDVRVKLYTCPTVSAKEGETTSSLSTSSPPQDLSRFVGSVSFIFVSRDPISFKSSLLNSLRIETPEQQR